MKIRMAREIHTLVTVVVLLTSCRGAAIVAAGITLSLVREVLKGVHDD